MQFCHLSWHTFFGTLCALLPWPTGTPSRGSFLYTIFRSLIPTITWFGRINYTVAARSEHTAREKIEKLIFRAFLVLKFFIVQKSFFVNGGIRPLLIHPPGALPPGPPLGASPQTPEGSTMKVARPCGLQGQSPGKDQPHCEPGGHQGELGSGGGPCLEVHSDKSTEQYWGGCASSMKGAAQVQKAPLSSPGRMSLTLVPNETKYYGLTRQKKDHILELKNALKINFSVFSRPVRSLVAPTVCTCTYWQLCSFGQICRDRFSGRVFPLPFFRSLIYKPTAHSEHDWLRYNQTTPRWRQALGASPAFVANLISCDTTHRLLSPHNEVIGYFWAKSDGVNPSHQCL